MFGWLERLQGLTSLEKTEHLSAGMVMSRKLRPATPAVFSAATLIRPVRATSD